MFLSFHYLPLYTGDYLRDTADLSMREHGAYLLLLAFSWQRSSGLPDDLPRLYRIAKARDDEDRHAVDYVVGEFFKIGEDGRFHNGRLERELVRHNALSKRGKAGAAGRWNGKDHAKPMLDSCETNAKPMAPSPSPVPTSKVKSNVGLTPDEPPLPGKPEATTRELNRAAVALLAFLNEKTGSHYQPVKANISMIVARIKEGFTEKEVRQVIANRCLAWASDPKMEEYLRPKTLFAASNFANYAGRLGQRRADEVPDVQ